MKTETSTLRFINFVVPNFHFEKKNFNEKDKTVLDLIPRAIISRSLNQFHISMEIKILDVESEFTLKMLGIGIFEYSNDNDEKTLLNFMSINGPAIVFPYLRGFISNFTSLTGFDTITLPTLNLSGYKNELLETLIDLDKNQDG